MSIKGLYQKALFLTMVGLILVLVIGNVSEHKADDELARVLYITTGVVFGAAFSFFTVAYIKMQSNSTKKREYNKARRRA